VRRFTAQLYLATFAHTASARTAIAIYKIQLVVQGLKNFISTLL